MKKFILFLAAAVATISCSKDAVTELAPSASENLKKVCVNLSLEDSSTRVDLTDDGQKGYTTTWTDKYDEVGAWCDGDAGQTSFVEFAIMDLSEDKMSATFYGYPTENLEATSAVRFVYPYSEYAKISNDTYEVDLTAQDPSDLSLNTHLISDVIEYQNIESQAPMMQHLGAALDIYMLLENSDGYALSELTINGLSSAGTVNLQDGTVADLKKEEIYVVPSSEVAAVSDIYAITINILPTTFAEGDKVTLNATFTKGDETRTATREITMAAGNSYDRSTRCVLKAKMEEDVVVELKSVTIAATEFGRYNTSVKTKTISEIEFEYLELAKNGSIQWRDKKGYIFNKDVMQGIESVQFVNKTSGGKNSWWTVMESATPITSKFDGQEVSCDADGLYTFSDGMNYFCVYNNGDGSGEQLTSDIVVKYEGGELPPFVTESTPAELAIVAEGGSASAEISGNRLGEVTLEATSGNAQFTASITGTTLTVTADANNTAEAISGIITVKIAGESTGIEVAVSQEGLLQPEVITLEDGEGFPKYSAPLTTFDISGATFGANYAYTYNYNGAIYKILEENNDKGYFGNITELKGLSKVVVTEDNYYNLITLYGGNSTFEKTEKLVYIKDGYEYTYDTKGYSFITFVNETTKDDATCDKVDFYYMSLGETIMPELPAVFNGLSTEAIVFDKDDAGEASAAEVTIDCDNIENAKTFTVELDNETDFTLVQDAADKSKFSIYPKAANTSDAVYTAKVTVTIDDVVKTIDVSQSSPVASVEETVKCNYQAIYDAMSEYEMSSSGYKILNAEFDNFTLTSSGGSIPFRAWPKDKTLRSYAGNKVTVTAKNGKKITSIEFSNSDLSNPTVGTSSGNTWSGEADEVTVDISKAENSYINITTK